MLKLFSSTAASGLALMAFSTVSMEEADAQTHINRPASCQALDRALASQRDYTGPVQWGLLGDAIGAAGSNNSGQYAANRVRQRAEQYGRARAAEQQQEARIDQYRANCARDLQEEAVGVCRTYTNETARTRTEGGRVVGPAQGSITERRNCVQTDRGGPRSGYTGLTPNY